LLFEHVKNFPLLRDKQQFIGTGQAQFTRWHTEAKAKYTQELINKGYPPKTAAAYAKKYVKKPRINSNVFMHSWSQPGYSGIAVNTKWGLEPDIFTEALQHTVKSNFHPIGCDTIKSVADHEFGHQLDNLLTLHSNASVISLYSTAMQVGMKPEVSGYAAVNIKEFIAECWAEHLNNANPRYFSNKLARIIKDEYAKQFPA